MISSTLFLVLGGCALGIIQLLAGIGIGLWLRGGDATATHRHDQDMIQAGAIARRLQALADDVSTSVGHHSAQLEQAIQALTCDSDRTDEALAELVIEVIDDIVRAKRSLKSKLQIAENKLREQVAEIEAQISRSLTDTLTGLPNRREFNDRMAERMSALNRRKEVFTLSLIDVDHFKKLNDQYGHLVGDRVLADIGRTLRLSVRRDDAVARYGGEEFAMLLPGTSLEQATAVADKVREAIAGSAIEHNGKQLRVTVSGGAATIQSNEDSESLIQRADAALYAAKTAGRNCVFVNDGSECHPTKGIPVPQLGTSASTDEDVPTEAMAGRESPTPATSTEVLAICEISSNETISVELAQTCEVLRRFVAERDERYVDDAPYKAC